MKKTIVILILTILTCIVFNFFGLVGTKAVVELSSLVVGMIYLTISVRFFREKQQRILNLFLGVHIVARRRLCKWATNTRNGR